MAGKAKIHPLGWVFALIDTEKMNVTISYPPKHYGYYGFIYGLFKYPKFRLTIFKNLLFIRNMSARIV
jgi:hypothetical protein